GFLGPAAPEPRPRVIRAAELEQQYAKSSGILEAVLALDRGRPLEVGCGGFGPAGAVLGERQLHQELRIAGLELDRMGESLDRVVLLSGKAKCRSHARPRLGSSR